MNGVGIATRDDFGAEPSRPASLLCTLRTHQSPGEWQHSLPACSLALTGRDFHPLDSIEWFHLFISRFPPPKLPQRDIAGLLFFVPRARRTLGAYRIPRETGLLIPSGKRGNRRVDFGTGGILPIMLLTGELAST